MPSQPRTDDETASSTGDAPSASAQRESTDPSGSQSSTSGVSKSGPSVPPPPRMSSHKPAEKTKTGPSPTAAPEPALSAARPASSADSKPQMPSIAVGPQIVRPGETKPPILVGAPDATSAAAKSATSAPTSAPMTDPRQDAESSRRLPRPGMLRDDARLEVKEFRQARNKRRKAPPPLDAGVLPAAGVAPPNDSHAPAEVSAADTDVLIASVASELIDDDSEALAPIESAADSAPSVAEDAAGSSATRAAVVVPSPAAIAAPPTETRARMWLVPVLLLGAGGLWWGLQGEANEDTNPPAVSSPVVAKEVASARRNGAGDEGNSPAKTEANDAVRPPEPAMDTEGSGSGLRGDEAATDGDELQIADTDDLALPADNTTGDTAGNTTGDAAELEIQPEPEAAVVPDHDPAPSRPRDGKKKKKKRAPPRETTPSAPSPAAPNAATLLANARKAYSSGNAGKAFTLARMSNKLKRSNGAVETMALASCQRKDSKTAHTMMKKLPRSRRSSVRERCRTYGVRLGL